ncbi:C2 domain-containing protein 5 isoform X2 [Vanessa atalanta]|uniref:C2 domain-containing protein 5 isoform X2 n=1 Tax=Vanessa atalanta TaxID=42275 RepID=UPI001FCD1DF0|nr:C2 domain-containing protein 5 isoform X2 [Vanessa atalanta]
MPGKIKVKVLAGRNLPVMDRASDTTDAFVEIKFGGVTHKTDVCRKSLNPQWNSTEWYRFEVDESELQDEPLQLRLMDHDTYSANDAIGKVVISLAPLLAREANNANGTTGPPGGAVMSGWIPVFDTMHGIRGELNVIVKVELFSDFNKYKTSSCGVQFFHCPMIPPGYRATTVHGFVEELIVNDDPEYQWIDKIRTPRASNEARQVAFIKLSNQVQRLVGLKAAELGANAVVGYQQDFDLEGEAGVVARAIGTAVSITALPTPSYPTNIPCTQQQLKKYLDILATDEESITDLNQYYQTHQEELQRIVSILNPNATAFLDEADNIDDDEKSLDLSTQKQQSQKTYTGDLSIYQDNYVAQKSLKHLSEDQIDLNKLLNREDPTESAGPLKAIKKIKDNLFSKKFHKRSRKPEMQDDQVSLQSTSSDTSRISLTDIKKEIKKIKKLKVKKLLKVENKEEEGYGMASILARSVMHADRSLARISEHQDSESSPCSTLRRTSESEPVLNLSDEDGTDFANKNRGNISGNIPEIHCSSLENIKSPDMERERKISESCPPTPVAVRTDNLLKLPGDVDFFGSISSALSADSSEIYTSSDEDDESFGMKSDPEPSLETTSSVVQSVLSKDVDPNFIAQMEKKLTVLELTNNDTVKKLKNIEEKPDNNVIIQTTDPEKVLQKDNTTNSESDAVDSKISPARDHTSERERDKYDKDKNDKEKGSPRHARHESYGGRDPVATATVQSSSLHSSSTPMGIHRRSSDSDLSVTPKGNSLNASAGNTGSGGGAILRPSMNSNNIDMLEYPFLTMTEYPPGFIVHIGGTVCARSVKLVDGGGESAARAAWWAELRTELRAHARALRCTAVLAYTERAAVREDVCVLSASGTAAVINLDCDFTVDEPTVLSTGSKNTLEESEIEPCSIAHVPYSPGAGPYRAELATCGGCRRARVPSVLLATCAKPNRLASYPKAITLTAVAARGRRAVGAEAGARDLSDQLPFLEYELHKLLLAKLRMQGANAIFSLQTQIAIGERSVLALASGTALRLAALPAPAPPRLKASENDKNAIEIQKALWDTFVANKAANGYDIGAPELSSAGCVEAEGDEAPALDLCADKDACVLELDEAEDVETARALCVRRAHMCVLTTAQRTANAPPHAFTQVWRARLGSGGASAERLVACALNGAAYKLRRLQPAALAATCFQLDAPEDEIQLVVSGTAIPLLDPSKAEYSNGDRATVDGDDDIFALDEEQLVKTQSEAVDDRNNAPCAGGGAGGGGGGGGAARVSLSTLGGVVRARACRRVCALRLLFVRETTAVRELGGLSGFLHTFTCEVLAIARAYAAALGGNALTSLYLAHLLLHHNAHKNQGQCLLSVGGDVVHVTY